MKVGDRLKVCFRQDERGANAGGEFEKDVSGKVGELHTHFGVLRMSAGYREGFSYWALKRIMRKESEKGGRN